MNQSAAALLERPRHDIAESAVIVHPDVLQHWEGLGPRRRLMALGAILIFFLCFFFLLKTLAHLIAHSATIFVV